MFRQGEEADRFYVILDGLVGVRITRTDPDHPELPPVDLEVAEIGKGNAFGDYALLNNDRRGASIYAKTNSHFLVLHKDEFMQVLGKVEARKLKDKVEFLSTLPIFHKWTERKIKQISYAFDSKRVSRNHVLFKEGDPIEKVYLVKEGEFQLLKKHKFRKHILLTKKLRQNQVIQTKVKEVQVAIVGMGEIIGEDDLVREQPHTSTCICLSTTAVLLEVTLKTFLRRAMNKDNFKIMKGNTDMRQTDRDRRFESLKSYEIFDPSSTSSSPAKESAEKPSKSIFNVKLFSSSGSGRAESQRNIEILDKTLENTKFHRIRSVSSFSKTRSSSNIHFEGGPKEGTTSRDRSPTRLSQLERQFESHREFMNYKSSSDLKIIKKLFPQMRQDFTRTQGPVKLHNVRAGLVIRSQSPEK